MFRLVLSLLLVAVLAVCWVLTRTPSASAPSESSSSGELRGFKIP